MDEIRKKIMDLDEELITLLQKRMQLSLELGKKKKELGKAVEDKKREEELFAFWHEQAEKRGLSPALIEKLWSLILNESIRVQNLL